MISLCRICVNRVRFESVETFRRWHCHTQSATDSICRRPAPIGLVSRHFDFPFVRGPSRTWPLTPGRPRADSLPPLSRCPRALRSARANSTPVDSCRLLSIHLLTHAAPHALGPARTPSSRRAAPVPSRRESTGVDRNRVARRSRPDPHKSRRSRLCVRRSRLRENSSWVQQEKTALSACSNELADYLTTKRIEFSYSTGMVL